MKAEKPLTEKEQLEYELQLEAELSRVQRQHRILERDRGAYSSGSKFVKQQRVISILEKEQHDLSKDLNGATSSTNRKVDEDINVNLRDLLKVHDDYDQTIQAKKTNFNELDFQIKKITKDLILIRSKASKVQDEGRILQGQKTVEALENKLEVANRQCCQILTENRYLREEIDHLLQERMNFNKLWGKVIENLNKGKAVMLDLIEQSSIAYNQREEWCAKLQALRTRARTDLVMHTQEMQELEIKIGNDRKLENFFTIKGRKRVMRPLEDREISKRAEKRKRMEEQLLEYKHILAEILELTGVDSVRCLVNNFLKIDEDNMAIFNYMTFLHSEIENFTHCLNEKYVAMDECNSIRKERAKHQSDNLVKLREELDEQTKSTQDTESELEKTNNLLKEIFTGINKLFNICNCSKEPFIQLLGNNTINDRNALLYLKVLEDKVCELLIITYYIEKTTPKKARVGHGIIDESLIATPPALIHQIVPTNPCPLCVEQEMVNDVIDSLQFVQTRVEVVNRLQQRLELPGVAERLHNVSACNIPKSRHIIQKRYQ